MTRICAAEVSAVLRRCRRPSGTGLPVLSGSVLVGPVETRVVVSVRGEIDCSTGAEFRELLERAACGRRDLVLDLSGVGFLDAAGLGVIAGVAGRLRSFGGSVELRFPSWLIYRICSVTRLTEVMHVEPPPAGRAVGSERPPLMSGSRGRDQLDVVLQGLARLAQTELLGADGVSITLPRHGRLRTVAATDEVAFGMDHDQYDTGEGPCLDAAGQGRRVQTGALFGESRWPAFVPKARARGIGAILSVPLFAAGRPVGAVNAYACTPGALPEDCAGWAELCTAEAFDVLTGESPSPDRPAGEAIRAAVRFREPIAQARNVVLARDGLPAAAADAVLRRASRRTGRSLRAAALDCPTAGQGPLSVRPEPVWSEVSPRQPDGTIYLRAGGDWTGAAAGRVRALFERAYRHRPTLVVADLAGVGEIDRAGLEALTAARQRLAVSGCVLELQNLPRQLRRQLRRFGLERALQPSTADSAAAPETTGEDSFAAAAV